MARTCTTCGERRDNSKFTLSSAAYQRTCDTCISRPKPSVDDVQRYKRDWCFKKKYGLTIIEYDEMVMSQCGTCAICGEMETKISPKSGEVQPLSVHHDHATGTILGLCCNACNRASGYFRDNPVLMRRAAALIEGGGSHFSQVL